jgi:Gpi18-like mannosyltransferase/predicted membrane-bound dolichyl-phosphate-mannose-protein mannosyltransferase
VAGLGVLLLVGLLIRLTLAYVLLPGSGFESDIGTFTAWALQLAEHGPGTFYATAGFADYPPGYLYVLWLVGSLGHLLAPFANGDAVSVTTTLIKLPAIFADVAVAALLYGVVRSWRSPRNDAHRLALIAAALYLLNPVSWYDSAIWGQTDAFGALIVLVTVAALVRGNSEGAAGLAVLAALIKPQFGIVLLPVVGIVLLRRHLLRPGSGPRHSVLAPGALRTWLQTEQGPWRLISSGAVGLALLLVLIAPFSLNIVTFAGQMVKTAAGYPYLSVNAFNPWALIGSNGANGIAFGGAWSWNPDTVPLVGPIPGVLIGGILLALGFAIGIARLAWREDRRSIVVVTIFLSLAFFMLPTRVHERYMFPIFGLLPLLAVVDRRWMWATVALSAAAFINLHGVLTTPLYASPNLEHLPFGDLFRQTPGVLASIALNVAGFVFVAWQMRPAAADEPDPYELPEAVPAGGQATAPALVGAAAALTSATEGGQGPALASEGLPTAAVRRVGGEPTHYLTGARRWLRNFIGTRSVRRDRSALLIGEPGGRLDRRDALLLLIVFASTLLLRTYRLEVPYSMHFDEVYHARTATEFLQDWRYDMPHSIYEYTHPHLAKYAMALGIEALGNNRVIGTQELDTTVKAAITEKRWNPAESVTQRNGDRLYVVTDTGVRAYDLSTRQQVATIDGTFDTITVDDGTHVLYLADKAGNTWTVDTTQLDGLTGGSPIQVTPEPLTQLADLDGDVTSLTATGDRLVAMTSGGTIVALDLETGDELGRTTYPDPTAVAGVTANNKVMVDPAEVTDAAGVALTLSPILDKNAGEIQSAIDDANEPVPIAGFITKADREAIQKKIDAEELPGVSIENGSALAIGLSTGVVLVDVDTFRELGFFGTFSPVTDLTLVKSGPDHPTIYATADDKLVTVTLPGDDAARLSTIDMPKTVERVRWNEATTYVHVLGLAQDGSGPTVYVIEPRSNSIFADARLTNEPQAIVMDVQADYPAQDRDDLLAIDSAGQIATVDVGNNQFAYRFPGVLVGSLMAVCIYLLARFLFARRSIALIVSLFVLVDGMMFANARIAMNDTYVAFFIVAAFTLFVPIWLGRWRNRFAIAAALAGVGVFLGLALASKWVGAYAIGCVALLILVRSALGRVLALVAMIGMTAFLGYIAITPNPDVANPQINYPFLLLMLGLTSLLAVAIYLRPVRLTRDEMRFALGAPIVAGVAVAGFGLYRMISGTAAVTETFTPLRLLLLGFTLIALGVFVLGAFWIAGRNGYGPMVKPESVDPEREPASPPPERGWLRPGSGFLGLPWILGLAAISVIPLAIYVISYIPWIDLGNQWFTGYPAGHTGQTFLDLQKSMYEYHNYLRATHPASSPWWAWPFDLKPVWFEQNDYAGGTTAVIYDTGNLVLFWLAIPAVLWTAFMAWKRRSLALTFVVIAIASLWLPWARIDRATFQYHIFTTLPFSFMALAYFLAELWHGPSKRTWMLARVAAAIAIIGPPLLWLMRLPLCAVARTESVNAGTEVCASLSRQLSLSDIQVIGLVLAIGGLIAAGILYYGLRSAPFVSTGQSLMLPVSFAIALLGVTIVVVGAALPGSPVFQTQVQAEWPAIAALALLTIPAYFVLHATDPRRYVVGALGAAVIWFVLFYPNVGSLPVPTPLSQIHLGLLPTWNWGFQFGVNMDAPNRAPVDMTAVTLLAIATAMLCVAAVYAVRSWRSPRVEDSSVSPLPEAG